MIAWALVWAMVVVFAAFIGFHALYRHLEFHTDAFDLGNMDQAVWNTLHGRPFRFTNRGNDDFGPPTRLSIHVEPIIFLLAPLYLIHSGPETLLITQTIAIALGAIPLFALSLRRMPTAPFVGVALVFAYLLSPFVISQSLWDFHPVALATPLLLLALWALDAERYGWFLAASVLAIATKEDVGLSVVVVGLLLAVARPHKWRLGVALAVGSLLWVALCFKVILPHFNVGVVGGNNYWYRYQWLGRTPTQAAINALTKPWLVWSYLMVPGRLGYVALLLRTAGGLGLLAPALLIAALPDMAVNLLSTHTEQYSGYFQYNAVITPYLLGAAVYGAAALLNARARQERAADSATLAARGRSTWLAWRGTLSPEWRTAPGRIRDAGQTTWAMWTALLGRVPVRGRWLRWALLIWIVALAVWNVSQVGRIPPFLAAGNPPSASQRRQMALTSALLQQIPSSASVCATDTLDPHLSDRYALYLAPDPQCYSAQYVATDLPAAIANVRKADTVMLNRMLDSHHYVVVGRTNSVIVLKRFGAPLKPTP